MISHKFLKVFGDSSPRIHGELSDLELKFYPSMGSKSDDFLTVFKGF